MPFCKPLIGAQIGGTIFFLKIGHVGYKKSVLTRMVHIENTPKKVIPENLFFASKNGNFP
jgi:hypothetical protein